MGSSNLLAAALGRAANRVKQRIRIGDAEHAAPAGGFRVLGENAQRNRPRNHNDHQKGRQSPVHEESEPQYDGTTTTTVTIIVNSARRGLVSLAQEVLAAGLAVELAAAFVAVVPSAVTVVGLAAALVAGPVGASDTLSAALPVAAGRCSFA